MMTGLRLAMTIIEALGHDHSDDLSVLLWRHYSDKRAGADGYRL